MTILGAFSLGALTVVVILVAVRLRRISLALRHLTLVTTQIAKGDYTQQIQVRSKGNLGKLGQALKLMMAAIKLNSDHLEEEKNKLEGIISSIPEGIVVSNFENKILLINPTIKKMFPIQGGKNSDETILEKIGNEDLIKMFKDNDGQPKSLYTREITLTLRKNKVRTYVLSSNLLAAKVGEKCGILTLIRDITKEKELEELREGFLRTVTHELRTPLTSIMGFLELINGSATIDDKNREWLKISLKEALNLKVLIDDLLDLSQIKAGRIKIHQEPFLIAPLLNNLILIFGPLALEKKLELQIGAIDPELKVYADSTKLRRVLVNLLSNAIKFTQAGYVKLDCIQEETRIVFSVVDTGIGIKEEETEVIFEKFRQVDYSSTRTYEGIGLGLSIVKQLVEMHGGEVWVDSVYGAGTSFYFSLPKGV